MSESLGETSGDWRRPSPREIAEMHTYADTDSGKEALHHTLGPGVSQAAPGSHNHRGADSVRLLEGVVITGSKGGNTALNSVIAALVELGATNETT